MIDWPCMLYARMVAVVGAERAPDADALGAQAALKQSYIDLDAICELLAGRIEDVRDDPPEV